MNNNISYEIDKIEIPVGLSNRSIAGIKEAKQEMQKQIACKPRKRFAKTAVIAACMAGAMLFYNVPFVNAAVNTVINNVISYFTGKSDSKYVSEKEYFEKINTEISQQAVDQDITLIINNVSMDESNINIFYTIKSAAKISKVDANHWSADFTAPFLDCKINGQTVDKSNGALENEAYFVDDYTLNGVHRLSVATIELTGDNWLIDIAASQIFGKDGNWNVSFNTAKSDEAAVVAVSPNLNLTIPVTELDYIIDVTIERLVIAPSGNNIVLKQTRGNFTPTDLMDIPPVFTQFVLVDDGGRISNVIDKGFTGFSYASSETDAVINTFEFMGTQADSSYLRLVPYTFVDEIQSGEVEWVTSDLGVYPIRMQVSKSSAIIIENVDISSDEIRIDYYYDGVIPFNPEFFFCDEIGEFISFGGYLERVYNRTSGMMTAIYTNKDNDKSHKISDALIQSIKQISVVKEEEIKLLDEYAVQINLK